MKVNEKFSTEVNLFLEIDKIHPLPFRDIFTPEQVNIYYLNIHGDRTLAKMGMNLEVAELAEVLSPLYSAKWDNIYQNILSDFPILESYIETIQENVTEDGETSNDTSVTNTDKVSAYNDENFVNNGESTNVNTATGTNRNTVVKDITKTITENPVENIKSALDLIYSTSMYSLMFEDINNSITLKIFD